MHTINEYKTEVIEKIIKKVVQSSLNSSNNISADNSFSDIYKIRNNISSPFHPTTNFRCQSDSRRIQNGFRKSNYSRDHVRKSFKLGIGPYYPNYNFVIPLQWQININNNIVKGEYPKNSYEFYLYQLASLSYPPLSVMNPLRSF